MSRKSCHLETKSRTNPAPAACGQPKTPAKHPVYGRTLASGLSIAVAVLFICTSVSLTVKERRFEYVMLRILGFGNGQVAGIIVAETLILGLAAAALAIPVGYAVGDYLNGQLGAAWFHVPTLAVPGDFARVLLPALALIPLAALPPIIGILRADLAGGLGDRQFG